MFLSATYNAIAGASNRFRRPRYLATETAAKAQLCRHRRQRQAKTGRRSLHQFKESTTHVVVDVRLVRAGKVVKHSELWNVGAGISVDKAHDMRPIQQHKK
jgi:hypothetical protein